MQRTSLIISAALAALLLAGLACGGTDEPTATPVPSATPEPPDAPVPTDTATPSNTPEPTDTARPVDTPTATPDSAAPPSPTPTEAPPDSATETPPSEQPTETAPAETPEPTPGCDCSADVLECADFSTQQQAQTCFLSCALQGLGDVHQLSPDATGMVCTSLP